MIFIPLTNSRLYTTIDRELEQLYYYNWFLTKDGYACRCDGPQRIYLHHEVIGYPPDGFETDHKNRIKLDNQRLNLHHVTHAQNMQNKKRGSSQYLGVFLNNYTGRWRARIKRNGLRFELGSFDSEHAAALAYNEGAKFHYGATATLNEIVRT